MNLRPLFFAGLSELGLEFEDAQIERMLEYLLLLAKWNKSFNLTAITEPEKMLSYHLLDSLSILTWCKDANCALDVGSGAGLPGIPLAIALPHCRWTLLDSNGKKTRFMQQALASCAVNNATVVKSRVEDYHAPEPLDVIVSRAYASLSKFTESAASLMHPQSVLLTMKTTISENEAAEFDELTYDKQEFELQVPGIHEKRSLISVQQRQL